MTSQTGHRLPGQNSNVVTGLACSTNNLKDSSAHEDGKGRRHDGGVFRENRAASGLGWEPGGPFYKGWSSQAYWASRTRVGSPGGTCQQLTCRQKNTQKVESWAAMGIMKGFTKAFFKRVPNPPSLL